MKVGDSVRLAIDDWTRGELEASMLHACNAVDGTAKKVYPRIAGNKERFTRLLRESYSILGPMGMPGFNLIDSRFAVNVLRPTAPGGKPDIADVIYGIHRCTHGHGDELPDGFALITNAADTPDYTRMEMQRGKLRLSDRMIFALLAVAVFSPANKGQRIPSAYFLTWGADAKMPIHEWWGRADDFKTIVASGPPMPYVTLDPSAWQS